MTKPNSNKILFIFSLIIFSIGVFLTPTTPISNSTSPETQTNNSSEQVLGIQSTIHISNKQGRGNGGIISQTTQETPSVNITSYDIQGEVKVDLYKANIEDIYTYLQKDSEGNQINPEVDLSKLEFIQSFTHNVSYRGVESEELDLPLEGSGIWGLKITQGDVSSTAYIVRSDIQGIVRDAEKSFVFWTQYSNSGKSAQGVEIELYSFDQETKLLHTSVTDSQGVSTTPFFQNADAAIIKKDSDIGIIPINLLYLNSNYTYQRFSEKDILSNYFIFTDRPIYQPGDKVYFKSIIRNDWDVRPSIPSGVVRVELREGNYWYSDDTEPLEAKTIPISNQGSIDGDFILPDHLKAGDYLISISRDGINSLGSWGNTKDYITFQVEHYRKPEYTIDISSDKNQVISGDEVIATIEGNYFSGQPLSGARVTYNVYKSETHQYTYLSSLRYFQNQDYSYGYWGGGKVSSGTVTLDGAGYGSVNIPHQSLDGRNTVYTIEAEYSDESGNPVRARKNVLVLSGEFDVYMKDYWRSTPPGKKVELPLVVSPNTDTDIQNIKLSASITRIYWEKEIQPDKKYPTYTRKEESLDDINTSTNSQGEALLEFTPQKEGTYQIEVTTTDNRENQIKKTFSIWIYNHGIYNYSQNATPQSINISLEKEEYLPGEDATININSQIPGRDVFIALNRRWLNRYYVVPTSAQDTQFTLPIVYDDMPNIYITAHQFDTENINTDTIDISVPADQMKTTVSITPDREVYGPGDVVTLDIETISQSNQPISSEVAVWAVDKAIYELSTDLTPDIFNTFWHHRNNQTRLGHSLEGITVLTAEMGGCFTGDTQILMKNGKFKSISKIKPGDIIQTRESENSSKLIEAQVLSTHSQEEDGYLIINQSLNITPNHILFANNSWVRADSLNKGDILLNSDGEEVLVNSIEWQKQKTTVYNLETDKNHTFIVNDIWVHNQKGASPRSQLDDIAYWNPTVRTDLSGKARVTFKLPDNLTTWKIQAVSASTQTHVGQNTKDIIVTKNTIVRPVLPNILRTGDKLTVSAIVHNFTSDNHDYEVSLDFDGGEIKSDSTQKASIDTNQSQTISWDITPTKEAEESTFVFTALSTIDDQVGDSIEIKVPIEKYGFWETSSEFFKLEDGTKQLTFSLDDDIDTQKSSYTLSLSPTLIGNLPTAMEYLVNYPYGCVEQTTSRFVPAVIAKENPNLFNSILTSKDVDEMIDKGIARLSSLQKVDGSWAWWRYGSSNYFITSYVLEYLLRAKDLGYQVDQSVLDKTQSFLLAEGQNLNKSEQISRIYGLTLLEHPTSKVLLTDLEDQTPDLISIAAISNIKNNYKNPTTNGISLLESIAKQEGNALFWNQGDKSRFGSEDASTAYGLKAFVEADYNNDLAAKAVNYLTRVRKRNYWRNTFATAQVVQSIVNYSQSASELTPNYTLSVTSQNKSILNQQITSLNQTKEIEIDLNQNNSGEVQVSKTGEGNLYGTSVYKQFHTSTNAKAKNNGLKVTRSYQNSKGEEYSIGVGDVVIINIIVEKDSDSELNYLVVNDQLPSGLIPINTNLDNEQAGSGSNRYDYSSVEVEYTKNGAILAAQNSSGTKHFTYKARAISAGEFLTPPTTAELMYSPEINGRSSSETITIENESRVIASKLLLKQLNQSLLDKVKSFFIKYLGPLLTIIILTVPTYFYVKNKKSSSKVKSDEDSHNPTDNS